MEVKAKYWEFGIDPYQDSSGSRVKWICSKTGLDHEVSSNNGNNFKTEDPIFSNNFLYVSRILTTDQTIHGEYQYDHYNAYPIDIREGWEVRNLSEIGIHQYSARYVGENDLMKKNPYMFLYSLARYEYEEYEPGIFTRIIIDNKFNVPTEDGIVKVNKDDLLSFGLELIGEN